MEKLYNGILLPEIWPPVLPETSLDRPLPVPYLDRSLPDGAPGAHPEVIDITAGRQLFADDFLIARMSGLSRVWGTPAVRENPVFVPSTPREMNGGFCPCACPFNGGVFRDPLDGKIRMWYHSGWFDGTGLAVSSDGIRWDRISDSVLPHEPGWMRDGDAVWMDADPADPDRRYKMMVFYRIFDEDPRYYPFMPRHYHDVPGSVPPREVTRLYASPDGLDWTLIGETSPCGDNSTFFYNPFRKKWVYSLRTFSSLDSRVRTRGMVETDDRFGGARWKPEDVLFWQRADLLDAPDPELGYYSQLYNLDCAAYESVMLGMFTLFLGPPNPVAEAAGTPKICDLSLGFSRDGFHFSRENRSAFLSSSRVPGRWDYGYLHPANGLFTAEKDTLTFYYSAFSGNSPKLGHNLYAGGSVGAAVLRRDGFASLAAEGSGEGLVLTEKLTLRADGPVYLHINALCAGGGCIRAEITDDKGVPLPGYSAGECTPFAGDSTDAVISFGRGTEEGGIPAALPEVFRLRFALSDASLYSFWFSSELPRRDPAPGLR